MDKTKLKLTKKNRDFGQIKFGFSFLEMATSMVIIGVLTSVMLYRNQLVSITKLEKASSLTKTSPVSRISNLVAWYETTTKGSFDASEAVDGSSVGTWYNINPYKKSSNNATNTNTQTTYINAVQSTLANKPTYTKSAINNLPALGFDGSNDYLNYAGTEIANSNYSVFVVEQRKIGGDSVNYNNMMFISGSDYGDNKLLHLGYKTSTHILFSQYNNDFVSQIAGYTSPIPRIHSYIFNSNIGKYIYFNGTKLATCTLTNCKTGLVSYNNANFGKFTSPLLSQIRYYYGDIGEIIIFNKALNDQERQDVETYLSKKWSITLSS